MTREEAKTILEEVKMLDDSMYQYNPIYLEALDMAISALENKGEWILKQRGNFVDIACSKCGYVRITDYAYNYTVEEIEKEFNENTTKQNFCECCGADMRGKAE